jgi:hypothetical protein
MSLQLVSKARRNGAPAFEPGVGVLHRCQKFARSDK